MRTCNLDLCLAIYASIKGDRGSKKSVTSFAFDYRARSSTRPNIGDPPVPLKVRIKSIACSYRQVYNQESGDSLASAQRSSFRGCWRSPNHLSRIIPYRPTDERE